MRVSKNMKYYLSLFNQKINKRKLVHALMLTNVFQNVLKIHKRPPRLPVKIVLKRVFATVIRRTRQMISHNELIISMHLN